MPLLEGLPFALGYPKNLAPYGHAARGVGSVPGGHPRAEVEAVETLEAPHGRV